MEEQKVKLRKPENTPFKQQKMKSWQPLLTPNIVILTFGIVGILFIIIGIAVVDANAGVVETKLIRYDLVEDCQNVGQCRIGIKIEQDMEAPVFFYYHLNNYYQNHRRYIRSRSDDQLRDKPAASVTTCSPVVDNGKKNADGQYMQYYPCGLIAFSMFNDSFTEPVVCNGEKYGDGCENLTGNKWQKEGIAWPSDVEAKFKAHVPYGNQVNVTDEGVLLPDVGDEDFMVWMRTAGFPSFRKLYRIINTSLQQGQTFWVNVTDIYPVHGFGGEKSIILTTLSGLGAKNNFLGEAFLIVGGLSILTAIIFTWIASKSTRKFGEITQLLD